MNIVIGKMAKHVSRDNAAEYIFGYTLMNDVSDRGGRADGRHGSDWQLGKSHDTFAPLGPYIVPREFVANPQKLAVKFTLNDTVMQDSNTDRMTHTVLRAGGVRLEHDDAAPWRPDLDGQPRRRRHRAGDAGVFQGRRPFDLHDRVDRHAAEPGAGGEVGPADGNRQRAQGKRLKAKGKRERRSDVSRVACSRPLRSGLRASGLCLLPSALCLWRHYPLRPAEPG